jgi:hypothetical protein
MFFKVLPCALHTSPLSIQAWGGEVRCLGLRMKTATTELLVLVIKPRHRPHRKRLFHHCVFFGCRENNVSTELFPSNGCCTLACLYSRYLAMGLYCTGTEGRLTSSFPWSTGTSSRSARWCCVCFVLIQNLHPRCTRKPWRSLSTAAILLSTFNRNVNVSTYFITPFHKTSNLSETRLEIVDLLHADGRRNMPQPIAAFLLFFCSVLLK